MEHPKFPIPEDEEGRKRYESAKKHAAWAKEQGKSSEEIHEIFKKVMSGTGEMCIRDSLHARRQAEAFIMDKAVTKKLFDEIAPKYTCLLYTSQNRPRQIPRAELLKKKPQLMHLRS